LRRVEMVMPLMLQRGWWRRAVAVAALAASVCGGVSLGQMIRALRVPVAGDSTAAEPQQGVYVRDSAIASDKFELGKRMERLKEWHKSADVYQEILEKYQDRVVPVAYNDKNQPIKYASVTVAVQERLARWPEEGLTVYRARYEPAAASLLEQAKHDDYRALHNVFWRYFVTEAAKQAGMRLMDLYLESGEFTAATWTGEQLLAWHPALAAERPAVLFRTALAHHLAGNTAQATRVADELKANYTNSVGTIAGKNTPLVEALAGQLQLRPPMALSSADDSWRTFGGDASRSLIPKATGAAGARIYSIELPGPNVQGMNEQTKRRLMDAHRHSLSIGTAINVMPVADGGELFFQDGYRVYAVHLESGLPLAGWAQTHGGSRAGQYWLPGSPGNSVDMTGGEPWTSMMLTAAQQHSLTVTEDAVLAVMGRLPVMLVQFRPAASTGPGTRLVCLDRVTGRQRWIASPRSSATDQTNAKNLNFSGSPLVVGDSVYVIARGSSGAGVEDCHVCCYGLVGGEYRWSSYVASSQSGGVNMGGMPVMADTDSLSHLAFASGRVYVLTNLGAVGALDAYSGATVWLSIYPRSEQVTTAAQMRAAQWGGFAMNGVTQQSGAQGPRPWEFNSVIVKEGRVFALPSDGRHILVYDSGTGEELKRIPREIEFSSSSNVRLTMLLAAMNEKLIAAGGDSVLFLDWVKADVERPGSRKLNDSAILYFNTFAKAIKGRPFVTADQVYVPWESALSIISIPKAKVVQRFPKDPATWAPEEGPGNVLVTLDHVVLATGKSVNVYTDLSAVRQKYLVAIKGDPGNVEARLVFSELMFNANEVAEAMASLDDAIQVLGGRGSMRPGGLRDRVFSDTLTFAQRAGSQKTEQGLRLAEELFDRAAAAAQNHGQQVAYRLGRAAFIESMRGVGANPDYVRAARLYQEILSDAEMRAVPVPGTDGTMLTAGMKAESGIADLIAKAGPDVYEAFEREAAAALSGLASGTDPVALLAVAERYPHSSAAPKSLMQAATMYQNAGQPRLAAQVLRRLYGQYESRYTGDDRARLAEAIARNYLAMGNIAGALGRLQRIGSALPGAKLTSPLTVDGKPLQTKDGQSAMTVREATEALYAMAQRKSAESLPDVGLPLPLSAEERMARKKLTNFEPQTEQSIIPGIKLIVKQPIDVAEAPRHDRVIVWAGDTLVCYAAGGSQTLWSSPALAEVASGLAWLEMKVLVWNGNEAALIDGDSGKVLWKMGVKGLPAVPAPAGSPDEVAEPARELEQRQIMLMDQRAMLRVRGGLVAVRPPVAAANAAGDGAERIVHVRPLPDRAVISTSIGRVLAVDLADGKPIWQSRLTRGGGIQQMLANDDFVVARMFEESLQQMVVLDSFNGQPVWRRRFVPSEGPWPANCALSPDGVLVWTTQQTLAAKDLLESGDSPTWERRGLVFAGIQQPDQLLIDGQEILAVCNSGQFVARCSLRRGDQTPVMLSTGSNDPNARLRVTGPRFYVVGSRSLMAYHLEQGTSVPIQLDADIRPLSSEVLLTKHYVVLPGVIRVGSVLQGPDNPAGSEFYSLQAYSRLLTPGRDTRKLTESGLLAHRYDLREPTKIKGWQAVEGGIYYVSGDDKLHFLKGTKK